MAITQDEMDRIHYYERQAVPKYPYWYGMKQAFYESIGMPNWLPVSCHLQHGVGMWHAKQRPGLLTLESHYPVIFVDNNDQVRLYKEYASSQRKKPVYPIGSVFTRYRQFKGIKQDQYAKGTLAYPSHSTLLVAAEVDWETLIKQYKNLPEIYHPITVSVYYKDILKNSHRAFIDAGFDVVTAGHIHDPNFVRRFYEIMPQFRYVISNDHGSHLYYAIEMGIPYFIYGVPALFTIDGQRDAYADVYRVRQFEYYDRVSNLFTYTPEEIEAGITIKPEQQAHVNTIIGKEEALSAEEIRAVLQRHQTGYYLKELALSPVKLPLRFYRSMKARFG